MDNNKTKKELLAECRILKLKNYSRKNKSELIELLKSNQTNKENNISNLKPIENKPNNVKLGGSEIAKGGYDEEKFIVNLINTDNNLREQLEKWYGKKIDNNAELIPGNKKSDYKCGNLKFQHKRTKKNQFGQIDRHYVDNLIEKIPELKPIEYILKNLCELPINPNTNKCYKNKPKKLNNQNYSDTELKKLIDILEKNKKDILNYAFNGYENEYKPDIFGISLFSDKIKRTKIIFWKMEDIINYLLTFTVKIRKLCTVIEIGNGLTFQRKHGDDGKKSANNFQFKFIPTKLPLDKAFVYEL